MLVKLLSRHDPKEGGSRPWECTKVLLALRVLILELRTFTRKDSKMAKTHPPLCQCRKCLARAYPLTHGEYSNRHRKPNDSGGGRSRSETSHGHRGGFIDPVHGWIDGKPVTAAFGWGTKEGHTLLADGQVNLSTFKQHQNHNHYGPGHGPHGNAMERFRYTGPGS